MGLLHRFRLLADQQHSRHDIPSFYISRTPSHLETIASPSLLLVIRSSRGFSLSSLISGRAVCGFTILPLSLSAQRDRRIKRLAAFHLPACMARPAWSRLASGSVREIFHDCQGGDDGFRRYLLGSSNGSCANGCATDAAGAKGKCAAEVQKFCATVEKGKGLVHACLEAHSSELSEACKTSMAEHAAEGKRESSIGSPRWPLPLCRSECGRAKLRQSLELTFWPHEQRRFDADGKPENRQGRHPNDHRRGYTRNLRVYRLDNRLQSDPRPDVRTLRSGTRLAPNWRDRLSIGCY